MTREEYKSFKEELAALDMVRKYLKMFDEFLFEYSAFKDMTAKERAERETYERLKAKYEND